MHTASPARAATAATVAERGKRSYGGRKGRSSKKQEAQTHTFSAAELEWIKRQNDMYNDIDTHPLEVEECTP